MMFIFLPINALALGTLPAEEVKNASGLYNLMRNLGGAIGLAIANTLIQQWQKKNYAHLRESMTATNPQVTDVWQQLSSADAQHFASDPTLAGLTRLSQLAWREADIMTTNQVFQTLALTFVVALLLLPLVKKVSIDGSSAAH